jgi:predicted nucleic acid-binding protein
MDPKVVVDASVWVSRLMPQDFNHNASSFWVERFTAEGGFLVAPSFLLIEIAASISRVAGDIALAKQIVEDINSDNMMQTVPLDAALVQTAVTIAADLQLRAGDATYVAVAHLLNIPLVSWDKEQLQRAGSLIPTYTPDNYTFQEFHEEE